ANAVRALRQGTGHQQGGRHNGKSRKEVQLSQPCYIKTQRVRVLDLHQGVFVALQWALLSGAGQLVKCAKLHETYSSSQAPVGGEPYYARAMCPVWARDCR